MELPAKAVLQRRSQSGIEFDSDELFGAGCEQAGKDPFARANFEHSGLTQIAQSVYDGARCGRADEKILPQLGLMARWALLTAGHGAPALDCWRRFS